MARHSSEYYMRLFGEHFALLVTLGPLLIGLIIALLVVWLRAPAVVRHPPEDASQTAPADPP
jgi:hypothetical protein